MQPLAMSLLRIIAARQTALVAGNAVLMRLQTSVLTKPERAETNTVILLLLCTLSRLLLPAQRQVRSRHDLDKVHKVVIRIIRLLPGPIQGIQMMIPGQSIPTPLNLPHQTLRQLRSKPQLMNLMTETVPARHRRIPPLRQVVHVHVAVTKTPAGGNVEVANHLVDSQTALDAAPLVPLLGEPFRVVLPLALFHCRAVAEGPTG